MRYNKNQISLNLHESSLVITSDHMLTFGEFFAGGGGCTEAAKKHPKIEVRWLLNHDKVAIKTNAFHNPNTKIYWSDIYVQDEHDLEPVDIIQASFECDYHSDALGGKPIDKQSYMMGWELYRYFKYLQPLALTVENVPGVKKWAPLDADGKPIKERAGEEFERWKSAMMGLGYNYAEDIRCAADDGLATIRTRYFAIFYRDGIDIGFPEYTHNEFGTDGKRPWVPCKNFIDLNNTGHSIFGRKFNEALPKHQRKPYSHNTLRRIGGGIKKYSPEFSEFTSQFISQYYGGEPGKDRGQSLDKPLNTIRCENTHQLITLEKLQFIADHCQVDFWQLPDAPLLTQLTRQTKQLITIDQIVTQYYGTMQAQSINSPLNTIPCRDIHQLVTLEKAHFIAHYFNSGGKPENSTQSIDKPLHTVMTNNKAQLITLLQGFDIKARFLTSEELGEISTFQRDYFNRPGLKTSHKNAIKMIGNAVPPEWFYKILAHNVDALLDYKNKRKSA